MGDIVKDNFSGAIVSVKFGLVWLVRGSARVDARTETSGKTGSLEVVLCTDGL